MLNTLTKYIKPELITIEQQLKSLQSHSNPLIEEVLQYVFNHRGKKLRPILTLLAAGTCNIPIDKKIINLATASEVIHTATLLHDDVVDNADLRRGKPSVAQKWDNKTAILVGDFLYSKAFELLISSHSLPTLNLFAQTTQIMASGEVVQLTNRNNLNLTEEDYFTVITNKTAKLFAATASAPAILTNQNQTIENALTTFGLNTGIAFQLIDDIFDYEQECSKTGKPAKQDLSTGQLTLPAIIALKQASTIQKQSLADLLKQEKYSTAVTLLQNIVQNSNGLHYTKEMAQLYLNKALRAIEPLSNSNKFKAQLIGLTEFVIKRIN